MNAFIILVISLGVASVSGTSLPVDTIATEPPELTLEEVLDRHAEAMGGKEAWAAMQTYVIKDQLDSGRKTTVYSKKPDKFKLVFEMDSLSLIKSYDGKNGWITRNGVYEEMRPGEALEMAEEPDFYEELMFAREKGYATTLTGMERLDSSWVYRIDMAKKESDVHSYYVNATTFLIDRIGERSEDKAWEGVYFQTFFTDFKTVDGYVFPFRWGLQAGDKPISWRTVTAIQINTDLPDSLFQFKSQ